MPESATSELASEPGPGSSRRPRTLRWLRGEILLVGALCAVAFAGSWTLSRTTVPLARAGADLWFDSDSPRVYWAMNAPTGARQVGVRSRQPRFRSHVHPLFRLLVATPTLALRDRFGLSELAAVRSLLAAAATLWILGIYLVLRWITERVLDALLFSLLALAGSAPIFWFATADTYAFGALSIVVVLIVAASGAGSRARERWFVLAGALSLAVTVTNWMFGIAAAFARFDGRRATQICANALLVAVLAWSAQEVVYPDSLFFLQRHVGRDLDERSFVLRPEAGGLGSHARAFLFHSTLAPELTEVAYKAWKDRHLRLSFQHSPLVAGRSAASRTALALWSALLLTGALGMARPNAASPRSFRWLLVAGLGGQFVLHAIYGIEAFLYSLHFQPLLILLVAYGARTRLRPAVLVAVAALVPLLGAINLERLAEARDNLSQRLHVGEILESQASSAPDAR